MKRISKIWIGVGVIIIIAIAAWLLSGKKATSAITFDEK